MEDAINNRYEGYKSEQHNFINNRVISELKAQPIEEYEGRNERGIPSLPNTF